MFLSYIFHFLKYIIFLRLIKNEGLTIGENITTHPAFTQLYNKIKSNKPLLERIIDRSTAVQLTTFRPLNKPDHLLLVANTHLYFHPDADHIRLLQIGFCMLYVQHIVEELKIAYETSNVSTIFCGDFNSVPECGIFKLMTEKLVPSDFIDWNSSKYMNLM